MDPLPLTQDEWGEVGNALKLLWVALLCAITAGLTLLTAHALIPSAISTGHLPPGWSKLRAPLYLTGILAVIGIGVALYFSSEQLDWLHRVYPRWWQ